jgi:hypothetical protein
VDTREHDEVRDGESRNYVAEKEFIGHIVVKARRARLRHITAEAGPPSRASR